MSTVEAIVGDFTLPPRHTSRAAAAGWSPSSAAPSATSTSRSAARSSARSPIGSSPATGCCSAPTWSRTDRLIAAYDDPGGVTEEFVRNGLHVLNRDLGADFDIDAFTYVPFWDAREDEMDLRLRAEPQRIRIGRLDLEVEVAAGEEMRVEISAKFRPERIVDELHELGFDTRAHWTDDRDDFGLLLATRH